MISIKGFIFILVFYLLFADAKRRFRVTRTRLSIKRLYNSSCNDHFMSIIGSSSNSSSTYSDESPTDPIIVIPLLFLGISICGCKIIYKCRKEKKHRKRVQQQINDFIDTHNKLMEICTIDQLNKTDVRQIVFNFNPFRND